MDYSAAVLLMTLFALGAPATRNEAPLATGQKNANGLAVASSGALGEYLTDKDGRTVYIFSKDQSGVSHCAGPCREGWRPVHSSEQPEAGDGIDGNKIGLIEAEDRAIQVTYNDHPLYYYERDTDAQSTSGQSLYSYDGYWYLITPSGNAIETKLSEGQP